MFRGKLFFIATVTSLFISQFPAHSVDVIKSGAICKELNQVRTLKNQSFICLKKNKKLVWTIQKITQKSKKIQVEVSAQSSPQPAPSPIQTSPIQIGEKPRIEKQVFTGPCDYEIEIDPYWVQLRKFYSSANWCLGPLKTVPVYFTEERPKIVESNGNDLLPQSTCQIKEQDSVGNGRAFPSDRNKSTRNANLHPGPQTIFQIIPIYSEDAPLSGKSPREDYKGYIEFLESYIKYASDGESKVEFRIPNEYIYFPKRLSDYDMRHENNWNHPIHLALGKEILNVVDSKINFSGIDLSIVVAPAGTSHEVLEQAVLSRFGRDQISLDGQPINLMSIATPATFNSAPAIHQHFTHPMWWFHELHHVGMGLADHNGDNFYQNGRGENTNAPGMGNWGLMSMSKTELTTWEKWMIGYITENQVRCASAVVNTTHWITPSSHKSQKTKLLVVHLSDSKVIVVESIRAGGLNYKLGKESEGALVYLVDTAEPGQEFGLKVLKSPNKVINTDPFVLSNATLKLGEKIDYQGIEVKVVETGLFGDVVTISRSS